MGSGKGGGLDGRAGDKLLARYRVTAAGGFDLGKFDPDDTGGLGLDKRSAAAVLAAGVGRLEALQGVLAAQDRWAVLAIFQGMDAAGKDGAVKHVFSGVNPAGCLATSFKAPSTTELAHDFLWRHVAALPERGRFGIHNRSWYEEVLVPRVHPEVLDRAKLPARLVGRRVWDERLEDIAAFERYLARQGTVVLKFFLHLSPEEQRRRLLARIEEPAKNWKLDPSDVTERARWADYQRAYGAAIRATAAPHAPWYVVPADHKWFSRLVIAEAIGAALDGLGLAYPKMDAARLERLAEAKVALEGQASSG